MNIVILDGCTLNPGDLSWDGFSEFGNIEVYDFTPPEEVKTRAAEAEIIFTNKTRLTADILEQLPKLRFIGVLATGFDVVDVAAAGKKGIPVSNIPAYGTDSVAQMVFAHILNLTTRVEGHAESVVKGQWSGNRDFCYWNWPLTELAGKTLGIIGLGRIGRKVAEIGKAFGMKVCGYDPNPPGGFRIETVGLSDLCTRADFISLHCPLTKETRRLIDADALRMMKKSAVLINTSRGGLVDTPALAEALRNGEIAAAGLDVLEDEPPPADHPLFRLPNCRITPHIAWATLEARQRLMDIAIGNLRAFVNGNPVNIVNRMK